MDIIYIAYIVILICIIIIPLSMYLNKNKQKILRDSDNLFHNNSQNVSNDNRHNSQNVSNDINEKQETYDILFFKNKCSELTTNDKENLIKQQNNIEDTSDFVYNNNCNCCNKNKIDTIKTFNNLTYVDNCCNTKNNINCNEQNYQIKLSNNDDIIYIEFDDNNIIECYTSYGCDDCYFTFEHVVGFIPDKIETNNKDINIYLLYGEGKTNCSNILLLQEEELLDLNTVITNLYDINKTISVKGIKISKK